MKFCIITHKIGVDVKRFLDEAPNFGHSVNSILIQDISLNNKLTISENLNSYDKILFKIDERVDQPYLTIRDILLKVIIEPKKVINFKSFTSFPIFSKLFQNLYMAKNGINTPFTEFNMLPIELPCVAKGFWGNNGSSVSKIVSLDEFSMKLQYSEQQIITQKLLPEKGDYRVLISNQKIIGMHKKTSEGSFVNNLTAGGEASEIEQEKSEIIREIAFNAYNTFHLDFAGIDIMFDENDQPMILEVNRAPGMSIKQDKIWRINAVKEILDSFAI